MIDLSHAPLFEMFRHLRSHEASSFLMAAFALDAGFQVRFFRNQGEAHVDVPLLARTVDEAIFYSVSDGKRRHLFNATQIDTLSRDCAVATKSKITTKALLHRRNLATPVGGLVTCTDQGLLIALRDAGVKRFVLKPIDGSMGQGVFLDQSALSISSHLKAHPHKQFLLEQFIDGDEHRLYVVGDRVIAAYHRIPARVIGNGSDTIKTLYDMRWKARQSNPFTADRSPTQAALDLALQIANRKWQDVPKKDEIVWLTNDRIPSGEGDFEYSLDQLPERMKRLAVDAARALGAKNCALDMVLDRAGEPFVLELNIRAMIAGLCLPWPTGPWNFHVPEAIIGLLFPKSVLQKRNLVGFDFASLRAEIFRTGRQSSGVDAAKFAEFR